MSKQVEYKGKTLELGTEVTKTQEQIIEEFAQLLNTLALTSPRFIPVISTLSHVFKELLHWLYLPDEVHPSPSAMILEAAEQVYLERHGSEDDKPVKYDA